MWGGGLQRVQKSFPRFVVGNPTSIKIKKHATDQKLSILKTSHSSDHNVERL